MRASHLPPIAINLAVFGFCVSLLPLFPAVSPPDSGARMGIGRLSTNADGLFTCAVKEDSTVSCWGFNGAGQLGNGTTTNSPVPVQVAKLSGAISVATGNLHACALIFNGTVSCWGDNRAGQLGNGTTTGSLTPVKVSGLSSVVAIAAGNITTCAVRMDGTAWCWGSNSSGQLGNGDATLQNRLVPAQVAGVSNAVSIAGGAAHTCALLADGTARCWGANAQGQLGNGTTTATVVPVAVSGLVNAVALSTGHIHTCAVRADGTAWCWGDNTAGQTGDGTTTTPRVTPVRVSGISTALSIAAGKQGTCVRLADLTVSCVGDNSVGEAGDGTTTTPRLTPVSVVSLQLVAAVSAGSNFACAMTVKEVVQCWGSNIDDALGNGSATPSFSALPLIVSGTGGSISARGITGGGFHTCARRANSQEACWGENANGQLGNDSTINTNLPVFVDLGIASNWTAAGEFHTCHLNDGFVGCWGANGTGQLGTGTTVQQSLPGIVATLRNVSSVAAGAAHTCVVMPALTISGGGTVACWGANGSGQLGNGNTGAISASPTTVLSGVFINGILTSFPLTNITAVAAGDAHTCALSGDGHVLCWGSNAHGQLGGTAAASSNLPVVVSGVSGAIAITAGAAHSCALLSSSQIKCWGSNSTGQIGDDTTIDRFTPVSVLTFGLEAPFVSFSGAVAIGAGASHTCALTVLGNVECWGSNTFGQLGTGDNGSRLVPSNFVEELLFPEAGITTMNSAVALTAGRFHSCVIEVGGGPVCWGRNLEGQLGVGNNSGTNIGFPVNSFLFNIDPNVILKGNGEVAEVTALVNCPAGNEVELTLELIQGSVSGQGKATGVCNGSLSRYPVTVPSQGPGKFAPGSGQATADAVVKGGGTVLETEHWQRTITLQ